MRRHLRVGARAAILELSEGERVGSGEAAPLPGYSIETLQQACEALRTAELPSLTSSEPIDEIRRAVAPLISETPSAAFALETALLGLLSARTSRSVEALLGGSPNTSFTVNALVDSIDDVHAAWARGIRTVKVKLGRRGFADERALIADIRDHYGDRVTVRADANGAWSLRAARAHLDQLAPLGLEYIEEPTRWPAIAELSAVVPLALDESLRDDAEQRIHQMGDGLEAVVLKPASLGGVLRCLEIADFAAARGVDAVVTHMMGGPIELRACQSVARIIGSKRACGLDPHPGLR